jgi:hypothetical protein
MPAGGGGTTGQPVACPKGQKPQDGPLKGVVGALPSTRKPRKGRALTWPRSRASPQSRLLGNSTRAAGRLLLRLNRPVASHCPGQSLWSVGVRFSGAQPAHLVRFLAGQGPQWLHSTICERPPGRVVSACLASSGPHQNHSVMPESSKISSGDIFCH